MNRDTSNSFTHRHLLFHGLDAVCLSGSDGTEAIVLHHGAQIVSWKSTGGVERLFLSEKAQYAPGQPVRGGVPVVFPQFARRGDLPQHGFAREHAWNLLSVDTTASDALVVLGLTPTAQTLEIWPHRFELELSIRVSPSRLDMELAVLNTDEHPWSFTSALHTYLRVEALSGLRLTGLHRLRYRDSVSGTEQVDSSASLSIDRETDRIYFDAARPLTLTGAGPAQESVLISQHGFMDVVVWNPWEDKAAAMSDFPNDGWMQMLCVEAAQIGEPITLLPGQEWFGRQSIECQQENNESGG